MMPAEKKKLTGAYSAFLMSAGRLNVSSGDCGPLFLIKQPGVLFRDIRARHSPGSSHFSRNSLICSLDRKKCPLVCSDIFICPACFLPALSSFFAYHTAKFAQCPERYVSSFLRRGRGIVPFRLPGGIPKPAGLKVN